jgi:hypothetical protein
VIKNSTVSIEYSNLKSNIIIDGFIKYQDFKIYPQKNLVKIGGRFYEIEKITSSFDLNKTHAKL